MPHFRSALTFATGAAVVLSSGGAAASADELSSDLEQRVSEYVMTEVAALGAPGAAVVVVQGDDVVYARGFGVTRVGGAEVTADTPFHIASVSKSLTALAVMQLVEAGQLSLTASLDAVVSQLVPDGSEASAVTIENLLGHTSGWSERTGLDNRVRPDLSPQALQLNAARILATPLSHPIGEFEYSNANYDVLGYLIEQASGVSYGDYLERHVLEPLEMTHTFTSEAAAVAGGVAAGHYPFFGFPRPHPMLFVPGSVPSSYLSASAQDLGHLLIAQLNHGRYGVAQLLSPEGMASLQRPIARPNPWDGYAMGLWVYPFWSAGRLVDQGGSNSYRVPVMLEHQGDSESYSSSILFLPKEGIGVVVLLNINDESVPSLYHQIHIGVASILLGQEPVPSVAYEGATERYAKGIALAVAALFLVRVAVSFWRIRRSRLTSVLRQVLLPLTIDVLLVAAVWWILADQADAPMALVRRSVPDIFLAVIVASTIGLGWGVARTALRLRGSRQSSAAPVRRMAQPGT